MDGLLHSARRAARADDHDTATDFIFFDHLVFFDFIFVDHVDDCATPDSDSHTFSHVDNLIFHHIIFHHIVYDHFLFNDLVFDYNDHIPPADTHSHTDRSSVYAAAFHTDTSFYAACASSGANTNTCSTHDTNACTSFHTDACAADHANSSAAFDSDTCCASNAHTSAANDADANSCRAFHTHASSTFDADTSAAVYTNSSATFDSDASRADHTNTCRACNTIARAALHSYSTHADDDHHLNAADYATRFTHTNASTADDDHHLCAAINTDASAADDYDDISAADTSATTRNPDSTAMIAARLINDRSQYHVGSRLVTREIRRHMSEAQMLPAEPEQLLLINGEGTLHHDAPGATLIREEVSKAPPGAKIVLLNAVWQKMANPIHGVALAVARETLSAEQMRRDGMGAEVWDAPDISLCCQHRPAYKGGGGLLVIDSVSAEVSGWLQRLAARHGGQYLKLCDWKGQPEEFIDLLGTYDRVITGRFHGATLCMLAGVPFLAAPSNTWKTRGLLRDIGLGEHYHTTEESMEAAVEADKFAIFDRVRLPETDQKWQKVFARIAELCAEPPASFIVKPEACCILVGNGPSLLGSGVGRVIDAHDEVVRFNNYQLAGMTADLGEKTTLWSTFGKGMKPGDTAPPERVIFIHGNNGMPACNAAEIERIPHAFYTQLREEIRAISRHKNASAINPTSGFLVIRWLLRNGVKRLHLAGFDHFSKQHCTLHHYWNKEAAGRPADHDGDAERQLLLPWVAAGRVFYLT